MDLLHVGDRAHCDRTLVRHWSKGLPSGSATEALVLVRRTERMLSVHVRQHRCSRSTQCGLDLNGDLSVFRELSSLHFGDRLGLHLSWQDSSRYEEPRFGTGSSRLT